MYATGKSEPSYSSHALSQLSHSEASEGGMKVGRIEDPLYKDSYLGIFHLPSSHLLRPPDVGKNTASNAKLNVPGL